ncbi:MAG: radical SAM protein [Nanoarchaeota archaeon]
MEILLVVPRYNLTDKVRYDYIFPIGLGYISAVIRKAGYNLDCINLNHIEGKIEKIISNRLNVKKYDIVMTGHIGIGYSVVEKIITTARNHLSKPKVIVGGALVTSEKEIIFDALRPDFAVVGEGEITILDLLRCIENKGELKKVRGIIFFDKGNQVFTGYREVIKDIDKIPFPDYESLGFSEYLKNQENSAYINQTDFPKIYPILCSRGCPYQCTFCYHSLGVRYRLRSLNNIFKEIEQAVDKYKINALSIHDDLFSVNKERLFEFCKKIKELGMKTGGLNWICQLSVNNIDKKLLETVKDAGCNVVSFGFESYSSEVLKSMRKPITPEQIDKCVKLCMGVGVGVQGGFIFGDTAETKETAKETLDYWKNNCMGQLKLGFIQPYPGSEIYQRCVERGIIKNRLDFIKNYMAHTNWMNMTEKMSDAEIEKLKEDILEARRKYYPYVIPLKIKKTMPFRYKIRVKCKFCNKIIEYDNSTLGNRLYYTTWVACKNCNMRLCVTSRLYKITMDKYKELDFFRKKYLLVADNLKKMRM